MTTVYTKANCRPCMQTKKALKNMGVEYNEVDLTSVPEKLNEFVQSGYRSAPIIVDQNHGTWSGYNPDKLKLLSH